MGYLDGKIRNPDIDEGGEKVLNNVKIYITEKSDPEYEAWVILFVVNGDALLVSVHIVLVVGYWGKLIFSFSSIRSFPSQ